MKSPAVIFLLVISLFAVPYRAGAAAQEPAYAPGELLVKYRPAVQAAAAAHHKVSRGISAIRRFKKIGVDHVKLPPKMSVAEALSIYRNDPDVEYAEPNYYRYAAAVPDGLPNDPYFDRLWGLHNSGQSVNGTGGTADADIDAPEAWDITTGGSDVVVAVIDTGIDYRHKDLFENIWTNPDEIAGNGIDDDGNGYVDDGIGWDFADGDNDPVDSHTHGTHVAGVIAAVGDNSTGVAGVSWSAKIMSLRVLDGLGIGTAGNVIGAIQYAAAKGAQVINLSLTSGEESRAEKDAIEAASAVVVCSAGNDGSDNDAAPYYPSSYPSPNIIAVAATDPNDELAFSNFGAASVDVAAPGVNIFSTMPARQTIRIIDFDKGDLTGWTKGGTHNSWGVTDALFFSGSYSLTDSPVADYENQTDSWAIAPRLDLSSYRGVTLEFKLKGESEIEHDFLSVELSTDLSNWTSRDILILRIDPNFSGSTFDHWFSAKVDLGAYDGKATVYFRFRFQSDPATTHDGFYIDDLRITAASSSYDGSEYQYLGGTSMAAAYVSGLAALLQAQDPSLTPIEIKARIENSVDAVASLGDKVAAGGRINAQSTLSSSGGGNSGPCFIAAAAGGTCTAEEIEISQNSRDDLFPAGSSMAALAILAVLIGRAVIPPRIRTE